MPRALIILEIMAGDVGFISVLFFSFTSLAERSAMIRTATKLAPDLSSSAKGCTSSLAPNYNSLDLTSGIAAASMRQSRAPFLSFRSFPFTAENGISFAFITAISESGEFEKRDTILAEARIPSRVAILARESRAFKRLAFPSAICFRISSPRDNRFRKGITAADW